MSNSYYNATGYPADGQFGASAGMRAELTAIEAAFSKLPTAYGTSGFQGGSWLNPSISGGAIDGTSIGATTPADGRFSSLKVTTLGTGLDDAATYGQVSSMGSATLTAANAVSAAADAAHVAASDPHTQYLQKSAAADLTFTGAGKLKVDGSGNLLFNTTTSMTGSGSDAKVGVMLSPGAAGAIVQQNSSNANLYLAKVSGYSNSVFVGFNVNGAAVGAVTTNGTTTTYGTTSDERLKNKVAPRHDAPEIDQVRVWDYTWKPSGAAAVGVMAQEAFEVFPDAVVQGSEDQPWYVDYSKFVPLLIARSQAQTARIAALEARLAAIETQLNGNA